MPLKLTTYYHGKDIPDLPGNNTFHSKELFSNLRSNARLLALTDSGNRRRKTCGTAFGSDPQN